MDERFHDYSGSVERYFGRPILINMWTFRVMLSLRWLVQSWLRMLSVGVGFPLIFSLLLAFELGVRGAAPVLVGQWPESMRLTRGEAVAMSRDLVPGASLYAVVAGGASGLYVVDLSQLENPVLVGSLDTTGRANGVALSGATAYVADGLAGLMTLDLSIPARPNVLSRLDVGGNAVDVSVEGIWVYVLEEQGGLVICDVSNPGLVRILSRFDLGMAAARMVVRGNLAYIAAASGLRIVDVSNPRSPTLRGSLSSVASLTDVWVQGSTAFVVSPVDGVTVVGVGDPGAPRVRGRAKTPGGGSRVVGTVGSGSYLLVGDAGAGLVPIDVRNPDAPIVRAGVSTGGSTWEGAVFGDSVCVLDSVGGIRVLRIPDATNLGAGNVVGRMSFTGRALDVSSSDSVLCLADGQGGLRLWGYANPAQPEFIPGPIIPGAVALAQTGGRVLVGIDGAGLVGVEVVDVAVAGTGAITATARGNFLRSRSLEPLLSVQNLALQDAVGYLAGGEAGLLLFDLSDADSPKELARVKVPGGAYGVSVSAGMAYVGTGFEGMAVVDVRVPTAPVVRGRSGALPGRPFVRGTAVVGGIAYLASGGAGVVVMDVSNPDSPKRIGAVEAAGGARRIRAFGEMAIVSAEDEGVIALDLKVPSSPGVLGSFNTDGLAMGATIARDQLFVADDSRFLVMALAGLTSGPNLPPTFEIVANPTVTEDSGPAEIRDWLRNVAAGPASEAWQSFEFTVVGSAPGLFEQLPTVTPDGVLRVHALTNAFGTGRFFLRLKDNGGTDNGGVDVFEREFTITVKPVNDPPIMDSPPDLGWRENTDGFTALMTGLYAGPPNERPLQRLTIKARSSRPDVIPDPIVDYRGGSEGRLLFRSVPDWSGRANVFLTITIEDDGGINDGGVNRSELVRTLSVRPVNDPPKVEILDPTDGSVVDPLFTSYGVSVRATDEEGPVEKLEIFADGVLVDSRRPEFSTISWTWRSLPAGPHVLVAQATDSGGLITTSAPVRFTRGVIPSLLVTNAVRFAEDSTSAPVAVRVADPDTPFNQLQTLKLRVTSGNQSLIPDDRILVSGSGANRTFTVSPVTNAFGEGKLSVIVEDQHGLTAVSEVQVTVDSVNDVPQVGLTQPVEGSVIRVGDPILLRAVASDVDGRVTRVQFFEEGGLIGASDTAPFQFSWTNAPLGKHFLSARAVDELGGIGTSQVIGVSVELPPNAPPGITALGELRFPEDTVSQPVRILLEDDRVAASQLTLRGWSTVPSVVAEGGVQLVKGDDGWRLTLAPSTNQSGSGEIVLVATDPEGASSTNTVPFRVLPVDDPPVIAFESPAEGATYELGNSVPIRVTAGDVDSPLTGLAVFESVRGTRLVRSSSSPLEYVWTNAPLGEFILTARTSDANGIVSTSAPVRVTVRLPDNRPPSIRLESESLLVEEDARSAALRFTVVDDRTPPAEMRVRAESLSEGLIPGADLRLVPAEGGWSVSVQGATNAFGMGTIRLTATDGDGASTSQEVPVTVLAVNDPPVVSLVRPASGSSFPFGSPLILEAAALDVEGPLARVEFLVDGKEVASAAADPFSAAWTGASSGEHFVWARAVDSAGVTAETARVRVVVEDPPNQPPELRLSEPGLTTLEDTRSGLIRVTVNDDRTPASGITLRAISEDPSVIPEGGMFLSIIEGGWEFSVLPATNVFGRGVVWLIATDTEGASATNQVEVTIQAVNDAPTVTWTSIVEGAVFGPGTPIPLAVEVRDVEGPVESVGFRVDEVLVGTVSKPPFAVSWNGVGLGAHLVRAEVRDSGGLVSTSEVLRIIVTPPANRAPSIVGGSAVTLYRDAISAPLAFTVGDDRTPLDQLTVRITASDAALFPPSGLVLGGSGSARTLVLAPVAGAFGRAVVQVEVSDNEGLSSAVVFPVTVLPVSELPGGEGCFADAVPEGFGTFNLLKHASYRQEPGVLPVESSAVAGIELRAPPRYTILSAVVASGTRFRANLARRDDGLYTWSNPAPESELLALLPFGLWSTSYRLSIGGGESFTGFFPFTVVSNVPPVPRLLELEAAQSVNHAAPFTLAWQPWSGSGTNDRVVLTVVDAQGNVAVSAASDCSGQTVIQRQSAGIEIPAGRLQPDTEYAGYLTFGATQLSVNDKSPLLMLRAYHSRTTQFPVRTLPAGGSAAATFGRVQLFGSSLVASMRGTPGVTYRIESSQDLAAWVPGQTVVVPSSGLAEVALPQSREGQRLFFRAVFRP